MSRRGRWMLIKKDVKQLEEEIVTLLGEVTA